MRPCSRAMCNTLVAAVPPWLPPSGTLTYGELYIIRSWNIQRVPTVQPSSTSPTRSESGTITSVMNS